MCNVYHYFILGLLKKVRFMHCLSNTLSKYALKKNMFSTFYINFLSILVFKDIEMYLKTLC